jgi:hypothetical protein
VVKTEVAIAGSSEMVVPFTTEVAIEGRSEMVVPFSTLHDITLQLDML